MIIFITFKPFSTPTSTQQMIVDNKSDKFVYKGQNGLDALTLLKNKVKVEQDNSELVVSINSRKADNAKHEYWAFYVNDKLATVGPASYQTSDLDIITWKIDKY